MQRIQVGIIGLGRIGRLHAQHIQQQLPGLQLVAVADQHVSTDWQQANPNVTVYYQAQTLIDDPQIEAVLICTPVEMHTEQAASCLQAGKHVFCEKPLGLEQSDITALIALAEQQQCILQVGFNRRFDPNFSKCQQAVADGKLGQPYFIRITSYDPEPPPIEYVKQSGGLFMDMTIHDFDMARFIMGCEVVEVFARGNCLVDPAIGACGDIDTAMLSLRFENGALGFIENSRQAVYGYDQRVEVFGSGGNMCANNLSPTAIQSSDADGVHTDCPYYFFDQRYAQAYRNELQAFYDCLIQGTKSPVSGHDGLMPLLLAQAAQQSLTLNQAVMLA